VDTHTSVYKNIEWISILAVSLRDEAVIGGIVDCAEKHTIQFEQTTVLVKLVFGPAFAGDLYDGVDNRRRILAIGNAVPRVLVVERLVINFLHSKISYKCIRS